MNQFNPGSDILRTYRRRLTNLSSRNRSLLLTSLPTGQFLDLHEADFLLNKSSFSLIADLISRKASVPVCEVLDARQERSNEVSRKLRRIDRTARFIEEERGTEDLYVGWPFVRGKFMDGTVVHGPLLFVPVQIEQRGKHWTLMRRGDEAGFLNPTFALAYGQFNQVHLPEEVVEKTTDDFDSDPLVFRTQLYEWLKVSSLEINFNPDLFTDKLRFFDQQNAKGLDLLERTGELKLYPEAVLGIFPQAGSFLVPDYDRLIVKSEELEPGRRAVKNDLPLSVSHSSPFTINSSLKEKHLLAPLPLDASQETALRAVKAGQSLVVQGPPGTGKSQLIANLMADAAAGGKRVLLVCQKRAALDVVAGRLRQVGMGPFLAVVHDFQDDRRALYAQLAEQVGQVDAYRQRNNGLNAVLLERDFDVASRRIDEAVADLQTFRDALFDSNACGWSAKELYLVSNPDQPVIGLDDVYQHFYKTNVDNFIQRLSSYAAYRQRLGPTHPWTERVSFAGFTNADQLKADQAITRWAQMRTEADAQTSALLGRTLTLAELTDWQTHNWPLTALLALLDGSDADRLWPILTQLRQQPAHPALRTSETRLTELAAAWADALTPPNPELSLPTTDLRAFRALLTDALTARPSWVRWSWWLLTHSGKARLQPVAAVNGLSLSESDLQTLAMKVGQRIRLEAVRYEAGPLLTGLAVDETPDGLRLLRRAVEAADRLAGLSLLKSIPDSRRRTHQLFSDAVSRLSTLR